MSCKSYDNVNYNLVNFNTGSCGRFQLYVNLEEKKIYKCARATSIRNDMMNSDKFNKYKKIIENCEDIEIMGKYLINGKVVTDNCADYVIKYIDGYRFDHLHRINDKDLLNKIKNQVDKFVEDLKVANSKKLLYGDWGIQNIIFDKEEERIYNIDTEGLYTYPRIPHWCRIDTIIENIYQSLYSNSLMKNFTAIIWNNGLQNKDNILEMIPNVITTYSFDIKKDKLHDTIFDIYSMDQRCNHNVVLPKKIDNLKKHNDQHLIIKFVIENPKFNNRNISLEAVSIKNNIRKQFSNIIHIADNYEESDYIWNKYSPGYTFDIYIKKIDKHTKIISKNKLDESDGNTVNVINVFNGTFKHTNPLIEYYCYKKINDDNYFFSDKCLNSKEGELCFTFFCTKYMIKPYLR
jgi:hypothetical protein